MTALNAELYDAFKELGAKEVTARSAAGAIS